MKQLYLKDYQSRADIVYRDFLELQDSVGEEMKIDEIDLEFLTMRMLKVFYKINPSDAKLLTDEQKELLLNKVFAILVQPKTELNNIIEYDGIEYGLISFDDMTAGELIDLDTLYSEQDFIGITSIIYRPIVDYNNDKYIIEDYQGFNDTFKDVGLNIIESYTEWLATNLSEFKSQYPEIYKVYVDEDGNPTDDYEEDESDSMSIGLSEKEAFLQEFGVYMEFIYVITQGDLLKKEQVFKMNANDFIFSVDYLIRKSRIENMKK